MGFPNSSGVKNPPAMQQPQEKGVRSPGWEDPLEKGMATHSSVLAWRIPWMEEPGGATVHRISKSWIQLKQLSVYLTDRDAETVILILQDGSTSSFKGCFSASRNSRGWA